MIKNVIFIFSFVIMFSCSERKADLLFHPINDMTISKLEAQDFERLWGVDVIMYGKTRGDTTISFHFDDFDETASSVAWKINMESINSENIDNILMEYDYLLISNYSCDNKLFVHNIPQNVLMRGHHSKLDNKNYMLLSYNFLKESTK